MSKITLKKMREINNLTRKFGNDGLKLLFLYKALKIQVKETIKKRNYIYGPNFKISDRTINSICIKEAYKIITSTKKELQSH